MGLWGMYVRRTLEDKMQKEADYGRSLNTKEKYMIG
jgi:hypothetical protein